ncbi:winged helix-turn-helix domain-containing protein [Aeromicrobium sp. NPDC092404]|uniref:ArsR/SmtB family transcription factor n=1 Tax=Aeromicrobium sp. NPDC092404 TaxID=3154976 RepID=UPI003442AF57
MLSIRLTDEDLRRVTFSAAEHVETIGALQSLRTPADSRFHRDWQREVRPALPRSTGPVLQLVPPTGEIPQALTPEDLSPRATPHVVTAMRDAKAYEPIWSEIGSGLVDFHRTAIAPVRQDTRRLLVHELARCASTLQRHGLDAALARLGDHIAWRPPFLHIDGLRDEQVDNRGRGLRLVPSVFWRRPGVVTAGFTVPTIVYPIAARDIDGSGTTRRAAPAALLGDTRSEILRALDRPLTTSEVADAVGTSLANASAHLSVLRQNGLIASRRNGRAVEHLVLPLGRRLLHPYG